MSLAQAKAYILLALGEMAKIDPNPVEPTPKPPAPTEPQTSADTLSTYGEVRFFPPKIIRANFDQKVRLQAFGMAGAGGKHNVSLFLAINGGPLIQGNRWDKTNSDVPVGPCTLYFSGGLPGVEYSISAIPE